jgi:hypothetical protein
MKRIVTTLTGKNATMPTTRRIGSGGTITTTRLIVGLRQMASVFTSELGVRETMRLPQPQRRTGSRQVDEPSEYPARDVLGKIYFAFERSLSLVPGCEIAGH